MFNLIESNGKRLLGGLTATANVGQRFDAENLNLSLILNLIRSGGATTRQDIENQSGLGRAIVVDRLSTLTTLGLIVDGALAPSTGGRAARHVRFNEAAGLILLASIDASSIGVAAADLSGHLLLEHHESSSAEEGPKVILRRLTTLFEWILEQQQPCRDVWGIGIAVSGRVETPSGQPFVSPKFHSMPGWEDYPLVEELAARYGVPVWVQGATQMKTLGEQRAGTSAGVQNMIYVDLDKEITAGLISQGHLHTGAQGGAGLIGHFLTNENNTTRCRCGKVGCLETAAGSDAIVREAMRAAQNDQSRLLAEILATSGEPTLADVGAAAQRGDPVSAEILARSGRLIGAALAEVANVFNPSLIVLAGNVAQASDIILATIQEVVYRRSHPLITRDLSIVRSHISDSAALSGTAISVIDELFSMVPLSFWVAYGAPMRHPGNAEIIASIREAFAVQDNRPRPPVTMVQHSK